MQNSTRPTATATPPGPVLRACRGGLWIGAIAILLSTVIAPSWSQDRNLLAEGDAQFRLGRFEAAVAAFTRTLERTAGREEKIELLARRAEALQALGHHGKAVADLKAALAEARRGSRPATLAALQGRLGSVYLLSGAPAGAQSELVASLKYAMANRDARLAARSLNNLGKLRHFQGRHSEAALNFEASVGMAKRAGEATLHSIALLNLARESALLDRPLVARKQVVQAIRLLGGLSDTHHKAAGLLDAAWIIRAAGRGHRSLDDVKRRFEALREAARIAEKNQDGRTLSRALGEQGRLYEEDSRFQEALTLTRRALFSAELLHAPELAYLWQWQLGRLYRATGDSKAALASYRRSVESLREIRSELITAAGSDARLFREAVAPVLLELVDLLFRESDRVRDARLVQAHLVEARSTLELFKTAELADYFQDDCVTALQAKAKQIDRLDTGTAAIYPIFLPDRIEILLSLPEGLSRTTVPVPVGEFNAEVARFAALLQDHRSARYRRSARRLYDWLIAPIEPKLRKAAVSTLVFIPDGSLRTIPISPLYDGRRHLVEKYAIAVAPGLTLLDPRPLARSRLDPLLSGLTRSVRGFAALPKVNAELSDIRQLYGGKLLKDQTFLIDNLQTELSRKPYSIIHIASHAQFDRDPKKSFVLTFDGELDMDGLERFIKLSRFRDEPVELLTLSACTTAEGDDRSALGLAGLAVKAGARSALGSLWIIEDDSTSILMSEFYRELGKPGRSKAEALRRAQIGLIRHSRYDHPFFWSAFILIGNWL